MSTTETTTPTAPATLPVISLTPQPPTSTEPPEPPPEKKAKFTPDQPVTVALVGTTYLRNMAVLPKALLAFRIWPKEFVIPDDSTSRQEGTEFVCDRYLKWRATDGQEVIKSGEPRPEDPLINHVFFGDSSIGIVRISRSGDFRGVRSSKSNHRIIKRADVLLLLLSEYSVMTTEMVDIMLRAVELEMPVFVHRSQQAMVY
jgi:hypothetical protein